MSIFAENNTIIYIEPINDLISIITLRSRWYKLKKIQKVDANITLISPITLIVSKKTRWIRRINQYVLLRLLKKTRTQTNNAIVWSYDPSSFIYFNRLHPWIKLYFIADEYTVHRGDYLPKIGEDEKMTMESADIVFAVTKDLVRKKQWDNKVPVHCPNAVDTNLFNSDNSYDVPLEFKNITSPIIGVVGSVREWVDVDLLIEMANRNPDLTLVSVGPGWSRKDYPSNMIIIGRIPYDSVPQYISHFNVALIPFKITEYTRSTNPLKLFEYLALGKPVVVTNMQGYEAYSDVVYVSRDYDEFSDNIRKALEKNKKGINLQAIKIAQTNTWRTRVNFISQEIQDLVKVVK